MTTTRISQRRSSSRAWRGVHALYSGGHLAPIAVLVAASLLSALAEAGVLALVADVAAALVSHAHSLGTDLGPVGLHVGVGTALIVAGILATARLLLQLVVAWAPARITADLQARLRAELFEAFTHASWSAQSQDSEGHLQELMTDHVNQATQTVVGVVGALSGTVMFVVLVGTAFALNPLVALIVLAAAAVLFWIVRPLVAFGRRAARDLSEANLKHAGGVSEAVRLAEEAQVFGAGAAQRSQLGGLIDDARGAFFQYQLAGRLMATIYQSLAILLIVGGLAGLYLTGAGDLAALGAIILMLVRASTYASQAQGGYQALNQVRPYLERLQSVVDRYRASEPTAGDRPLSHMATLACERVQFAYRRDRPVLLDIDFTVEAGEAIGIVGPSGAGKSSLVQLLLRLREPCDGAYLVNGAPASSYRRDDWHRRIAYVSQEPRIMHATVAENIRFFRGLGTAAIERAARSAHIHDDILRLPAGYDTVIGQVADAMSGGQRQRICLARALAGEPDLLVLDEPTSALDMASEAAVQASLAELHGSVTLFVVAHRISTISTCDRILVLEHGRIDAFAPAAELELNSPFYQSASGVVRGAV